MRESYPTRRTFLESMKGSVAVAFLLLLLGCGAAHAPRAAVALPGSPAAIAPREANATAAAPTPRPQRAYTGEPLTCAPAGAPCVYLTADPSRKVFGMSADEVAFQALWLRRPGATDLLLTETQDGERCADRLVGMGEPTFSPDGARLFLTADCAATSAGIREIDLRTGRFRFVTDGTIDGFAERADGYHLLVRRYLLDLDHDVDDPDYRGRSEYLFDVDPATGASRRIAGPLG
jgi:hypothetical protein